MKMTERCQRCGRRVPARMRDTGFCTARCLAAQVKEDRASFESELSQPELAELQQEEVEA